MKLNTLEDGHKRIIPVQIISREIISSAGEGVSFCDLTHSSSMAPICFLVSPFFVFVIYIFLQITKKPLIQKSLVRVLSPLYLIA